MHPQTQRSNAGRGRTRGRTGPAARTGRGTAFSQHHQTTSTGSEHSAAADYQVQRHEKRDAAAAVNVLAGVVHRMPWRGGPMRFIQTKPKMNALPADLEQLQARSMQDRDAAGMTAPPVVDEALNASGQPMDNETRAFMEPRFGWDFSNVRIHADARSAVAARAVQARAFTSGPNIVFGEGEYSPGTSSGKSLIAHELTHVVQQGGTSRPASASGTHETAMERGTERSPAPAVGRKAIRGGEFIKASAGLQMQKKMIQRKKKRKFLGGILGAIGGAIVGALVGGPIGAIVGAIGGAIIGDKIARRQRRLTDEEKTIARGVFHDSIDYSKVVITRNSMFSVGSTKTIGNKIHFLYDSEFKGDTMELSGEGMQTLIHELGHVWQYQNGGIAYIPKALWAQYQATRKTGDRDAAYEWLDAHYANKPWEKWNPEQQASLAEDYYMVPRILANPTYYIATYVKGKKMVERAKEAEPFIPLYIGKIRERKGAPRFF